MSWSHHADRSATFSRLRFVASCCCLPCNRTIEWAKKKKLTVSRCSPSHSITRQTQTQTGQTPKNVSRTQFSSTRQCCAVCGFEIYVYLRVCVMIYMRAKQSAHNSTIDKIHKLHERHFVRLILRILECRTVVRIGCSLSCGGSIGHWPFLKPAAASCGISII